MNTNLGYEALTNIERFKHLCTEDEFKTLEEGILNFDRVLSGSGFEAIQAKQKLTEIKNLEFNGFTSVMYEYFGKTPSQYLNQAL